MCARRALLPRSTWSDRIDHRQCYWIEKFDRSQHRERSFANIVEAVILAATGPPFAKIDDATFATLDGGDDARVFSSDQASQEQLIVDILESIDSRTVRAELGLGLHLTTLDGSNTVKSGSAVIFLDSRNDEEAARVLLWLTADFYAPLSSGRIVDNTEFSDLNHWRLESFLRNLVSTLDARYEPEFPDDTFFGPYGYMPQDLDEVRADGLARWISYCSGQADKMDSQIGLVVRSNPAPTALDRFFSFLPDAAILRPRLEQVISDLRRPITLVEPAQLISTATDLAVEVERYANAHLGYPQLQPRKVRIVDKRPEKSVGTSLYREVLNSVYRQVRAVPLRSAHAYAEIAYSLDYDYGLAAYLAGPIAPAPIDLSAYHKLWQHAIGFDILNQEVLIWQT